MRFDQLSGESWIEGARADTPCSLILADACERAGFEPRVLFDSSSYAVVQRLVEVGLGVALVPALALGRQREEVTVRPLAPQNPVRRVGIATRKLTTQAPPVAAMFAALRRACQSWKRRPKACLPQIPMAPWLSYGPPGARFVSVESERG